MLQQLRASLLPSGLLQLQLVKPQQQQQCSARAKQPPRFTCIKQHTHVTPAVRQRSTPRELCYTRHTKPCCATSFFWKPRLLLQVQVLWWLLRCVLEGTLWRSLSPQQMRLPWLPTHSRQWQWYHAGCCI